MSENQRRLEVALPRPRAGGESRVLTLETDRELYIPRLLQFRGLAAYEPSTLACFLACLEIAAPGDALDVGANVGVFSWLAAALSKRRVIAFEPFPALAAEAQAIAASNQLPIEIERLALGDHSGRAGLHLSTKSDCSHSLSPDVEHAASDNQTIAVEIDTLDARCQRLAARPAVIKIDTETTEPDVLRGAAATLATHRPWIVCEILPGRENEIAAVLEPLDYRAYRIGDATPLPVAERIVGSLLADERNWLLAPEAPGASFWSAYDAFAAELAGCKSRATRRQIECAALDFSTGWRPRDRERFRASDAGGGLEMVSGLGSGERLYFFHGETGFDDPGAALDHVAVEAGRPHELELPIAARGAAFPSLRLWVFQYDERERLRSDHAFLLEHQSRLTLAFDTTETTRAVRVAFQLRGEGSITVGPLGLAVLE